MASVVENDLDYSKDKEKYDKEMLERKENKITQKEPVKVSVSDNGTVEEKTPKKTRKRRTKKQTIDTEPIEKLLMTTSNIVATRPDMAVWKMSKQEAHAIAEPLGQVLEKYDIAKPLMENAPEISLLVAVLGFTAPRMVATIAIKKESNKDGFKGKAERVGSAGGKLNENRKSDITPQQNDGKHTPVIAINDAFGSSI